MTNDELKKKISDIIQKAGNDYGKFFKQELEEAFHKGEKHFGNRDCSMTLYDYISDALIAAGIGDVSEYKSLKAELRQKVDYINELWSVKEYYKHRALVAERALREFAAQNGRDKCPFLGRCNISPDVEDDYQCCFDMYLSKQPKKNLRRRGK